MHSPQSLFLLLGVSVVSGLPSVDPTSYSTPSVYDNWQPAGFQDLRSPCPLLNSFANHNFIPRNGRNLTIPMLEEAFKTYINVGPDIAVKLGTISLGIAGPNATSFTLKDIRAHNVIEHDGSISRSDYALGDDFDFNPIFFAEAASHFAKPTINVTDAAAARFARMSTMMKLNPDFNLTDAGLSGSFLEQSFYLSIFGDPYIGVARSDWVKYWFVTERLPTHLGWSPRVLETNLTTLMPMAARVMAATPGS